MEDAKREPIGGPPSISGAKPGKPPRKRRRWLRRLLGGVAALLLLAFLSPLALGLSPIRNAIASSAGRRIERDVEIGALSAWWWGGIDVRDVVVHDRKAEGGATFVSVERVHVDLDLLRAIAGTVRATVEVVRPVATLRRTSDGRRNVDDLVRGEGSRRRREHEEGRRAHHRERSGNPEVAIRVVEGRIVSLAPREEARAPDAIDAIGVDVHTWEDGRVEGSLHALAKAAAPGGGDAPLDARFALDADGAGPVSLVVAEVDLAHLREVVGALGVEDVAGRAAVDAKVVLDREARPSGTVRARVQGLALRTGDAHVAAEAATFDASPAGDRFPLHLAVTNLSVKGVSDRDEGFLEPALTVDGTVERVGAGGLSFGTEAAPFRIEGRSLSGTASGSLQGLGGDKPTGDLRAHAKVLLSPTIGRLAGLLRRSDDDLRGTVAVDATVTGGGGAPAFSFEAVASDLLVGGGGGSAPLREPSVTFSAEGRWDEPSRTIVLSKAGLASAAATIAARDRVAVRLPREKGEPVAVMGQWIAHADLARLRGLRAVVPALDSIRGGRVAVAIDVDRDRTTKLGVDGAVEDLSVGPNAWSSRGFETPSVSLRATVEQDPREETVVLTVTGFRSTIAWLGAGAPARVRLARETVTVETRAEVNVDLYALGVTFDRALGLGPTDVLAGSAQVVLAGADDGAGGGPAFDVGLSAKDVVLPRAPGLAPARVDGRVRVHGHRGTPGWTLSGAAFDGFGLALKGDATVAKAAGGYEVARGHGTVTGDLAAARGLIGVVLGLPAAATVSGSLDASADVTPVASGRRVAGKAEVRDLRYAGGGGAPALAEPIVTLEHDVTLGASRGTGTVERLTLTTKALRASAKGTAGWGSETSSVDLAVDVDGDAKRLAEDLRAVLGKDYDDLTGDGRLAAKVSVSGPSAHGLRDLRVGGDASLGRVQTGGVTLTDAKARLDRPNGGVPLSVTATSGVNGGTLDLRATLDLATEAMPWTARVSLRGVDTAPVVTGKGASRVLPLVLPALVPAGSTRSVLSGRLDGDVELASTSVRDPSLLDALSGPGSLRMSQGSISESTLFAALSGKGSRSKGLAALAKVVPGLGAAFEDLGRSVVFSEMTSRFTVGRRVLRIEEVRLESERAKLRFDGTVGFDGKLSLDVPLHVGGEVGKLLGKVLPDGTIPLEVRGTVRSPSVEPKIKASDLGKGFLDDLLRRTR